MLIRDQPVNPKLTHYREKNIEHSLSFCSAIFINELFWLFKKKKSKEKILNIINLFYEEYLQ